MYNTPENLSLGNLMIFLQCLNTFLMIILIIVIVALVRALLKRPPTVDDPTGEKKQKIFNSLNRLIEDVQTTV